ncbi:hypothetical protein DEO72_LG3g2455 [Vigna unguiculata]|uniref:Uncharacterized protein n=1 Tax=Vigna unguiculata TaxID=3917 RepID=A0A4D6LHV4_VIGUN|nr:hypothetical protein DEO72_LG3g2455 [Vigna unguiculata]
MQDLDVNCGWIREELDWTTERQEKELYKLVKEDVRQEEKKGQPRLPTGPEPSLFDQRASFLESPVRTAPTQAVKRNPDRANRGSLRDPTQACSIKGRACSKAPFEQDRPKRLNETPIGPTEAPYGTQTKPVRSKGEFPRKPRSNRTDPSAFQCRLADGLLSRPRLPTEPEPSLFDQRASFLESPVRTGPTQAVKRNPDRADQGSLRDPNQACSIKGRVFSKAPFEQDRPKRSNETPIASKNNFSMPIGRWADRPTEAPYGTRTKLVRSRGELSRKPHVNRTDPCGQMEAR